MVERYSCALASRALGEACYGTASQIRRWILVEQPGSWGANAVSQSGLPHEVARMLRRLDGRVLLIRRHGRAVPGPRSCFVVTTTQEVRRIDRLEFGDAGELLDVDWSADVEPFDGPLYLVCTNGSHDACCAQFGRPVARALAAVVGERLWEASHYGGDRFAGNLVCLPDGIYYGRVDPAVAATLVYSHAERRIDLDHYRGRSFHPFPAQAADFFVREALDLVGIDEVVVRRLEDGGDGAYRVLIDVPGRTLDVTVACSDAIDPQRLTCSAATEEHPPRYRLVSMA